MTREPELLAAVDVYFRALHACDTALLDSVFHPSSTLFDVDEGVVTVDPYPAWREVVANRPSPASVGQDRLDEGRGLRAREADLLVDGLAQIGACDRLSRHATFPKAIRVFLVSL